MILLTRSNQLCLRKQLGQLANLVNFQIYTGSSQLPGFKQLVSCTEIKNRMKVGNHKNFYARLEPNILCSLLLIYWKSSTTRASAECLNTAYKLLSCQLSNSMYKWLRHSQCVGVLIGDSPMLLPLGPCGWRFLFFSRIAKVSQTRMFGDGLRIYFGCISWELINRLWHEIR